MTKPKQYRLKRDYPHHGGEVTIKGTILVLKGSRESGSYQPIERMHIYRFHPSFVETNTEFFEPVIEERKKVVMITDSDYCDFSINLMNYTDEEENKERLLLESVLNRGRMPEEGEEYYTYLKKTYCSPHPEPEGCFKTTWNNAFHSIVNYYLGNFFPIKDYPTPEDAKRACQEWWDTRGKFLVEGER